MSSWWVHSYYQHGLIVELISWIFWVLLSITLHELAHGWAALWQGDDTPVRLRRLSLNPIVHMGPYSLVVFALCGIAWGQMPVTPHRFRDRRLGDVYVSAAGPAMNVAIGLVCMLLLVTWMRLCPAELGLYRPVSVFLYYGCWLNLLLAPFNLIPIPPLDGSRVLAGLWPRARRLYEHPNAPLVGMFLFIAIFFMSPIGGLFFDAARGSARALVDAAGSLVGNPPIMGVLRSG